MIENKKASPGPPKKSLPRPLRKEGSAYAHTRDKGQGSLSDSFLQNTCELALPSFTSLRSVTVGSEGSGEASFCFLLSLCKTDSYKGICGTCYSSTPKNDCFQNKVAYLCKTEKKAKQPNNNTTKQQQLAPPPCPSPRGRGVISEIPLT